MVQHQQFLRLVILGAPGAGKGTICTRLTKDFPTIKTISTGNLIRSHMVRNTELGKLTKSIVQAGNLVPDNLVNELMKAELSTRTHLMLDGYPRTVNQAEFLGLHTQINAVIQLDVPESVILDRILKRWVHLSSGRTYHSTYSPPKVAGLDDVTGEPLIQRIDDTTDIYKERLRSYEQATKPLTRFYTTNNLLQHVAGNTSDEIYVQIHKMVENLLNQTYMEPPIL